MHRMAIAGYGDATRWRGIAPRWLRSPRGAQNLIESRRSPPSLSRTPQRFGWDQPAGDISRWIISMRSHQCADDGRDYGLRPVRLGNLMLGVHH